METISTIKEGITHTGQATIQWTDKHLIRWSSVRIAHDPPYSIRLAELQAFFYRSNHHLKAHLSWIKKYEKAFVVGLNI